MPDEQKLNSYFDLQHQGEDFFNKYEFDATISNVISSQITDSSGIFSDFFNDNGKEIFAKAIKEVEKEYTQSLKGIAQTVQQKLKPIKKQIIEMIQSGNIDNFARKANVYKIRFDQSTESLRRARTCFVQGLINVFYKYNMVAHSDIYNNPKDRKTSNLFDLCTNLLSRLKDFTANDLKKAVKLKVSSIPKIN